MSGEGRQEEVDPDAHLGWSAAVVRLFLDSQLSLLLLIVSALLGTWALIATPREEDPQIVVPVVDVSVEMPGASPREIERLVAIPFEGMLAEIPGVEHVYSTSFAGRLAATARFFVGEDLERSITKVTSAIEENRHLVPPGVTSWQVRPIDFDRVPIVTIAIFSKTATEPVLREIGLELLAGLRSVPDVGETALIGGRRREVRLELDPARLAGRGITPLEVASAVRSANVRIDAGSLTALDREIPVRVGPFLQEAAEVEMLVVGMSHGADGGSRPIHLREVADVVVDAAEPESYERIGFGPAADEKPEGWAPEDEAPCVTITLAKRRGTNAVAVADAIEARFEALRPALMSAGVSARVVRDFGATADEKVHELVLHLSFAVVCVLALVGFALGFREALIVALAVPVTIALTIALAGAIGYSINRVSLFALILSLGLLVDDPIVDVENIHRHFRRRRHSRRIATLIAIDEIRPPTVLATLAVMVSFLPLFSMSGLLGPYMEPMAFNVPVAMAVSLFVAFTITPWAAYHFLHSSDEGSPNEVEPDVRSTRIYRAFDRTLRPMLDDSRRGTVFLWGVALAFVASLALIPLGLVPIKLLPFDNKQELAVVIDAPEGTTLERIDAVARRVGAHLQTVPEVVSYQTYAGSSGPIDINGLIRRYDLRSGGHVAEVRVNLLHKHDRVEGGHAIALRLREDIAPIANETGVVLKVVEIPPGPPVLAGIVAEIHGPPLVPIDTLEREAEGVAERMAATGRFVEIDSSLEQPIERLDMSVDRVKAALHGISAEAALETVRLALPGAVVGGLRRDQGREPFVIRLRLPDRWRGDPTMLALLEVTGRSGSRVPLGELVTFERSTTERSIQRKDLERIVVVTAEASGMAPVESVIRHRSEIEAGLSPGHWIEWSGDGEWKVTMDSSRDLGRAYAFSLAAIYVLLVAQTGSLARPGIVMLAIPLTAIGVFPGFWLLNLLLAGEVRGVADPIFFSGPALMGLIALSGIVVRNSIILLDFVDVLRARGQPLHDALLEALVTRLRPILLTAGAAVFGAWIIVADPIFSGLAWTIVFGLVASTALTLVVVPVVYAKLVPARTPQSET